jgi:hypothetical protein
MASSYGTCIVGELPRSLWLIGELSTCPLFEALAPYYHSRSQPPPNSWLCTGAATSVRVEKIGTSLDGPAAALIGMRSFDGLAAAETRRRAAPGSPLTATFPSTPPPVSDQWQPTCGINGRGAHQLVGTGGPSTSAGGSGAGPVRTPPLLLRPHRLQSNVPVKWP